MTSAILFGQLKLKRKLPELSNVELMLRRIERREQERGIALKKLYKQLGEIRQANAS